MRHTCQYISETYLSHTRPEKYPLKDSELILLVAEKTTILEDLRD